MNRNIIAVSEDREGSSFPEWEAIIRSCGGSLRMCRPDALAALLEEGGVGAVVSALPWPDDRGKISLLVGTARPLHVPVFQCINGDIREGSFDPDEIFGHGLAGAFFLPATETKVRLFFGHLQQIQRHLLDTKELISEAVKYREQKNSLIRIGTALSAQSDLHMLLELILKESRGLVDADAGSIYIKGTTGGESGDIYSEKSDTIVFRISQNDSVEMMEKSKEFAIPIGPGTISGYVAYTNETLNLPDVYLISSEAPYKFGLAFDARFGYRTKSMLTVPMENRKGDIVGVLQLINKKENPADRIVGEKDVGKIISFGPNDEELIQSLASQAAVAVEKAQLYQDIENLFKGFVESSVAAIEARDEPTSGHSKRVRAYALEMAHAINEKTEGPFKDVFFDARAVKEFEYASLLHDIGKIGVREAVLVKPTRLSADRMGSIEDRWRYWGLLACGRVESEKERKEILEDLEERLTFVKRLNKATFLSDDDKTVLDKIRTEVFVDDQGEKHPYLQEEEHKHLSIRKGNLTDEERAMINSHADSTRQILSRMSWTRDLEGVINIACHHHEKIDGSGYPDKLQGTGIPLQSRILATIDIFEALVAQDRPYKPPMPVDKALKILEFEAKDNHIDRDVLDLFVNDKIYQRVLDKLDQAPA